MIRVLLTRRWVLLTVVFLAMIVVMYRLGWWQFHRYQQTKRNNHQVSLVVHARPVPIGTLSHPGATVPGSQRYRPVTATGHFDAAHQFVVRRRTNTDGDIGFFLITPLITGNGDAVLVNRGWVAANSADGAAFPALPKTPAGTLTLTGRLQPDETATVSGIHDEKGLPPRQYMMISSREQAPKLAEPVVGGYLELVRSSPPLSRADSAQTVAPPGVSHSTSDAAIVGQGVHLPYAIQWWLFALMVPVGWWILLRQELKDKKKPAAQVAAAHGSTGHPRGGHAAARARTCRDTAAPAAAGTGTARTAPATPAPSTARPAAPTDRLSADQLRRLSMQPAASRRPRRARRRPGSAEVSGVRRARGIRLYVRMTVHDIARALPEAAVLRDHCRSMAMLEAVLNPEWAYRSYAFNAHWSATETMASMHNGSGDEFSIVFSAAAPTSAGSPTSRG